MRDQGYESDEVDDIQKNMLIYKSIAQIKQNREAMKNKMKKAQDKSQVKSRLNFHQKSASKSKSNARKKQFDGQKSHAAFGLEPPLA